MQRENEKVANGPQLYWKRNEENWLANVSRMNVSHASIRRSPYSVSGPQVPVIASTAYM